MKYNLKNRPNIGDADNMKKWFEGFEKELRQKLVSNGQAGEFWSGKVEWLLKEILEE